MEYSYREDGDKAIFNSKIQYGIAVYLIPISEREEVKTEKLSPHTKELQIVQNNAFPLVLVLLHT